MSDTARLNCFGGACDGRQFAVKPDETEVELSTFVTITQKVHIPKGGIPDALVSQSTSMRRLTVLYRRGAHPRTGHECLLYVKELA